MKKIFTIKHENETQPLVHYWEKCVGSCHAYTALRADYQQYLKKAHDELGFEYVRFHGLFDDNMSVCMDMMSPGRPVYSFHNIDVIYDYLLRIGMRPFVELGFMPSALASGEKTCFLYRGNITPPKDYDQWYELIRNYTLHVVERYGIDEVKHWFFEVWNEPNMGFFWAGTQEEYFKLYEYAARAIKSVHRDLRVGGPASAGNSWIVEFKRYCSLHDVPVDFISTHHYPTSDPLGGLDGGEVLDMTELLKASEEERNAILAELMNPHYDRGVMKVMTEQAKKDAGALPLYYTEWNSAAFPYRQDEPYSAAFVAKTLTDNVGLVEGYSFWTVSDIFEESMQQSLPFHNGFGLLNIDGIPKPVYHTFALMRNLGTERLEVSASQKGTVELLATKKGNGISMVLYNHNEPFGQIEQEEVVIVLNKVFANKKVILFRVDEEHANPKATWIAQGEPVYPTQMQLEEMFAAAQMVEEESLLVDTEDSCQLHISIPPHSVVGIDILDN